MVYIMKKRLLSLAAAGLMLCSCSDKAFPVSLLVTQTPYRPSVIIDAGHGGADGGGVSVNGIPEKGINLNIALTLSDIMTLLGYDTKLTRTEDISIHDEGVEGLRQQKISDMDNRLKLFNTPDSVCVSIHQNRFTDPQFSGAQMFYYRESSESAQLAESLRSRICSYLQPENTRETKPMDDELFLLCNCENPAVMAECGFISNPEEAAMLEQQPYQKQVAFAIMTGLNDYHIQTGRLSEKSEEK